MRHRRRLLRSGCLQLVLVWCVQVGFITGSQAYLKTEKQTTPTDLDLGRVAPCPRNWKDVGGTCFSPPRLTSIVVDSRCLPGDCFPVHDTCYNESSRVATSAELHSWLDDCGAGNRCGPALYGYTADTNEQGKVWMTKGQHDAGWVNDGCCGDPTRYFICVREEDDQPATVMAKALRPAASASIRSAAEKAGLEIGAFVDDPTNEDARFRNNVYRHFTSVSPRACGWEEGENSTEYESATAQIPGVESCKRVAHFASVAGQRVLAGPLVQSNVMPEFLRARSYLKKYVKKSLADYVEAVIQSVGAAVQDWVVVAGAIRSDQTGTMKKNVWQSALPEYVTLAFQGAAKAKGSKTRLYYHESGAITGPKADGVFHTVRFWKQGGLPIDGISLGMHIYSNQTFNVTEAVANMKRYGAIDMDIWVAGVEIVCSDPCDETALRKQANLYAQFIYACVQVDRCIGVTLSGVDDAHLAPRFGTPPVLTPPAGASSPTAPVQFTGPKPYLFSEKGMIKPSGQAVLSLLRTVGRAHILNVSITAMTVEQGGTIVDLTKDSAGDKGSPPTKFRTSTTFPSSAQNAKLVTEGMVNGTLTGALYFDASGSKWVNGYHAAFATSTNVDDTLGDGDVKGFLVEEGPHFAWHFRDLVVPPNATHMIIISDTDSFVPVPPPTALDLIYDVVVPAARMDGPRPVELPTALPVVIFHGSVSSETDTLLLTEWVKKKVPGIQYVRNLVVDTPDTGTSGANDYFNMQQSRVSPSAQVEAVCQSLRKDEMLRGGFNAIGWSRGGVLLRAYVERCNNPPVKTLISVASPHSGSFGPPYDLGLDGEEVQQTVTATVLQSKTISPMQKSEDWRDGNMTNYTNHSGFLLDINNEGRFPNQEYKRNMLSLTAFVMVGLASDDCIKPLSSEMFGWIGEAMDEVPMEGTPEYKRNAIGLRTLNLDGRLHRHTLDCNRVAAIADSACLDMLLGNATRNPSAPETPNIVQYLAEPMKLPSREEPYHDTIWSTDHHVGNNVHTGRQPHHLPSNEDERAKFDIRMVLRGKLPTRDNNVTNVSVGV